MEEQTLSAGGASRPPIRYAGCPRSPQAVGFQMSWMRPCFSQHNHKVNGPSFQIESAGEMTQLNDKVRKDVCGIWVALKQDMRREFRFARCLSPRQALQQASVPYHLTWLPPSAADPSSLYPGPWSPFSFSPRRFDPTLDVPSLVPRSVASASASETPKPSTAVEREVLLARAVL